MTTPTIAPPRVNGRTGKLIAATAVAAVILPSPIEPMAARVRIAGCVSPDAYRRVCIAWCVSQGVYRRVRIAGCVSPGVYRRVCIAGCVSRGVYLEVYFRMVPLSDLGKTGFRWPSGKGLKTASSD